MRWIVAILFFVVSPSYCFSAACPETIAQGETTSCDSITQYGITWTFVSNETVGQFVNGDYFVINDGTVVVSVSPDGCTEASTCKHGSMVNPTASSKQGHDYRAGNFDFTTAVQFPYTMVSNDSLMSTVSWETTGYHYSLTGDYVQESHGYLKSAAVLTCLATQPASGSFRPGYAGATKQIYNISDLQTSRLQNFPQSGALTESYLATPGLTYTDIYKRPWIHYGADWLGRAIHPTDNMPNYYRESFGLDSEAAMLLHTNISEKTELLYNFIQRGIDMASVEKTKTTYGDRMISKAVLVFTGVMLGDSTISSLSSGREISQVYYGTGWAGQTVLWRDKVDLEYESTTLGQWKDVVVAAGCGCKAEAYRRDSHSWNWVGSALAIRLMNGISAFNKPEYFDYVDRWMTEADQEAAIVAECSQDQTKSGTQPQCWSYSDYPASGASSSAFVTGAWTEYRNWSAGQRYAVRAVTNE